MVEESAAGRMACTEVQKDPGPLPIPALKTLKEAMLDLQKALLVMDPSRIHEALSRQAKAIGALDEACQEVKVAGGGKIPDEVEEIMRLNRTNGRLCAVGLAAIRDRLRRMGLDGGYDDSGLRIQNSIPGNVETNL